MYLSTPVGQSAQKLGRMGPKDKMEWALGLVLTIGHSHYVKKQKRNRKRNIGVRIPM